MSDSPAEAAEAPEAAEAAELRARLAAATARLQQTAAGLSDAQVAAASGLPGWSRGHLLAHIARNADSLRNLLIWARTGVETPQYATPDERAAGIAAGAGRLAAEQVADLRASADLLDAEAAALDGDNWAAEVRGPQGPAHPAWFTLWRRLQEVEIHHVDLVAGYRPADWPEAFAAECLPRVTADVTQRNWPRLTLRASDSGAEYQIGQDGDSPVVTGDTRQLLAWLIGRSEGAALTVKPAGPLPDLPSW
jgi:maleylpyruvate isomerase